jgi:hypothetical protein
LVIGGKCKESIFGKGRVARKLFIGGKAKHAHITGGISYFTQKNLTITNSFETELKQFGLMLQFSLVKS